MASHVASNRSRASRLQESSNGTDDGHEANTSLGSSAGELRGDRLGGAGLDTSGVRGGSVLGWVRNDRGSAAVGRGSVVAGGLDWGRSGLDLIGGGVLAVIIDESGAGLDGVGLVAVGDGGWLGADGGQASNDLGGGVGRGLWVAGVLRSLGALRVGWVLGGLGALWVGWVLRSLGGLVGWGSNTGGVVGGVAVRIGVGSGGEASNDSEGAHLEFGVGIKYGLVLSTGVEVVENE